MLVEEMVDLVGGCVADQEDRSAEGAGSDLGLEESHDLGDHSSLEVEVHKAESQGLVRSHLAAEVRSLDQNAEEGSSPGIVEDAEGSQEAEAGRETGCDLEMGPEQDVEQV